MKIAERVMKVGFVAASAQLAVWTLLMLFDLWLPQSPTIQHLSWIYLYLVGFFPWMLFLRGPWWDIFSLFPTSAEWVIKYLEPALFTFLNWFVNGCLAGYFCTKKINVVRTFGVGSRSVGLRSNFWRTYQPQLVAFSFSAAVYAATIWAFSWVIIGIGDMSEPPENPFVLAILYTIDLFFKFLSFPSTLLRMTLGVNDDGVVSLVLFSSLSVLIYSLFLQRSSVNLRCKKGTDLKGGVSSNKENNESVKKSELGKTGSTLET